MKPIVTDNAETIRALAADTNIDRDFRSGPIPRRILRALSYKGVPFPHMTTRKDPARLERHEKLWVANNEQAPAMAAGPEELEPLAQWIRQENQQECGILVQQAVGLFFQPDFPRNA